MANIEDLQVTLESVLCVQSLETLNDRCKYPKIELSSEDNTRLKIIKVILQYVETHLEKEPGTTSHKYFLEDIISYMTGKPPPLEGENTDEEISQLEKMYDDLKLRSRNLMK